MIRLFSNGLDGCSDDLYTALETANIDLTKNIFVKVFAAILYNLYSSSLLAQYEGYYSVVIYSYILSIGVDIQLEKPTNKGRLDMVIDMNSTINTKSNSSGKATKNRYLIEFKIAYSADAQTAIQQIKDKEHFQSFLNPRLDSAHKIYLVGICFDENERNLGDDGFEWEEFTT